MLEINLKEQNGIYNTVKLIDAFKLKDKDIVFALLYKEEKENDLMKIYITKYENNLLKGINDEEWQDAKTAMYNIVSKTVDYEVVKIPNVITLEGELKACLIKTVAHFEEHYKKLKEDEINPVDEASEVSGNFRFTNEEEEWKKETPPTSLDSLLNQASALTKEDNEEVTHESYKVQKEKMINMISKTMDTILEDKTKEVLDLQRTIEKLDKDLRKSELEKKKAMDIIDMYHEKIQKLTKLVKENRSDK